MDSESLKRRIAELVDEEKRAWAQINYIVGCREECQRWLDKAQAPAPEETPPQE
jgi:hypothetical protein